MFELLVQPEELQLDRLKGNTEAYDLELRPRVRREDCKSVVAAARYGGRHNVGCIVLGRGEDDRKVHEWLGIAAAVPGFVEFAIGRTVFWDPLVDWRSKRATRDQTVAEIARRYRQFVDLFERNDANLSSVASRETGTSFPYGGLEPCSSE
jgi:5-dehydro-2-deoxygluconokinase